MFLAEATNCRAQTGDVLCREGVGNFDADLRGSAKVHVGAVKNGGLATRSCEATLIWGDQHVTVANGVFEVDLDAFGADLGWGVPVSAFQLKKSDSECCRSYQIYSLQKLPHLLRSLTGGTFFCAADTDLDGRVEIWTDDGASLEGIENLTGLELDSPPTVVLRFEHNRLLDVSSQFQPYFDSVITNLRARLDQRSIKDFKESDGKLLPSQTIAPEKMQRLRRVKIAILEIVWSYLYSGREAEAWAALADVWPSADAERIRAEIIKARNHGMRLQVDGVAPVTKNRKKHAMVFDLTVEKRESGLIPPRAILLRRPPGQTSESIPVGGEEFLNLTVDSAGKVRSVEPAGNSKSVPPELIDAATGWKFIPALSDGRAVASRMRLAVSDRR